MAIEDFLTYQVSPDCTTIDVTSNRVDYNSCRNEDCYLYKDFGVDFFGNFEHHLESMVNPMKGSRFYFMWAVTNEVEDFQWLINNGTQHIALYYYTQTPYIEVLRLRVQNADGSSSIATYTFPEPAPSSILLSFVVRKIGTLVECDIYDGQTYIDTISVNTDADYKYRYLFAAQSFNSGSTYCASGFNQNFELIYIPGCKDYTIQAECEAAGCYWYNGSCHSVPATCEDYEIQVECEAAGCYWYNNSCHDSPPSCEAINNQIDCLDYGCYWWNNACHSAPPPCSYHTNQADCEAHGCYWCTDHCQSIPCEVLCTDYTNQTECEAANCYWYNESCHDSPPSCEAINNQIDCLDYGCYWYNNSCHSTLPPCSYYTTQVECEAAGCYWCNGACQQTPCDVVCSDYTTQMECEAANCYWYNESCHSTPPPPEEIPWAYIAIGVAAIATATVGALIYLKRR